MLWWVAVLPQVVLLLINLRAFWIVSGEFQPWQREMAQRIFAFEVFLLIAAAAVALTLRLRRSVIPWALNWPLFAAPIFYLWLAMAQIGGTLIPASAAAWILPPEQLLYYQFAFIMPAIFYSGVRLACVDLHISRVQESGVVAGLLVGVPLVWFLALQLALTNVFWAVPASVFMVAGICSTALVLGAAARACVSGYVAVRRKGPLALAILSFLVGVAAPVGGLALNAKIPFPADFQGWGVIAMALANGCFLLLPNFRHPHLHRAVWFAQCAFFPFTLYFFVVFLPFLPLSIPAMIVAGAGFLILTPTVLFLLHGQRILDGFRDEIRDGSRLTPAILGALALAILPGICIAQAVVDRVVLRGAIDYIYSPDYRRVEHFAGSREAVRRSLERLRDSKAGLNLPFLSDFYNWAVFDNLVLPDDKMSAMHRAFFGRDLAPAADDRISIFGGQPRRGGLLRETRNIAPPPSDVALVELTTKIVPDGDCERTTLTLDMRNNSAAQSEFATQIELPEGVFVSGFWLKIGDETVPGRLFEKKTALWVYQMIRDRSRRDPGILIYSDPHTIDLRVFPFAAHEQRRVEIQFLYPAALHPALTIGDRSWRAAGEAPAIFLTLTNDGTSAASFTPQAAAQLPRAERTPYLHFIVDRSANSNLADDQIVRVMRETAAHFGAAKECAITLANYEFADLTHGLAPIEAITPAMLGGPSSLVPRGGFLADRAIRRVLLGYHDQLSRAAPGSPWLQRFPVMVLIHDPAVPLSFDDDLKLFARLAPDAAAFYVTAGGGKLEAHDFSGKSLATDARHVRDVALLRVGDAVAPCVLGEDRSQVVEFAASKAERTLSVLGNGAFRALAPTATIAPDTAYSHGVSLWQRYLAWIYNPSLGNSGLSDIVDLSRASGILVAATSYIVVEDKAQWKMLDLKQRQKLRNQAALEFEQVPEPTATLLALAGGAVILCRKRRRMECGAVSPPRSRAETDAEQEF